MLKKITVLLMAVIICIIPSTFAFADDVSSKEILKAATVGTYEEGDLAIDSVTGVESITGYDYIYSNPDTYQQISVTLQNTTSFTVKRHYLYGGLHNCYLNTLIYTGGGFGNNQSPKEIPGNIAQVRIADSVKNGAGDKFDLLLQIKNLVITPDPAYCTRDPKVGVNLFYYQEKTNPIISTTPTAYDAFGTTSQGPSIYGRYKVEFEYELRVVLPGTDENAPRGTLLYGSRDFDSDLEGYEIVSGVMSGTEREDPTIYVEPDTITSISYEPARRSYRICGTAADENTWRSGFAALFDSSGSTLRWFGFRQLGTTIIGQEAYEFTKYYNVRGEIIKGEGSIDPVDVTVQKGMNVNCVIDPADDYYISVIRLYSVDDQGQETLLDTLDSWEVKSADPYYIPINNIDRNYRYEVEFERKYRIDLKVINGRVGSSGDTSEATYTVIPGGTQDLKYSGFEGYELRNIDVDGSQVDIDGHGFGYSFMNVQSDHEVTVTYERRYHIETSVTNGSITDDQTIWAGDDSDIEYAPDPGYHLKSVTVDGTEQDIALYPEDYFFENVNADHRIEVIYEANRILISKVDETGSYVSGAVLKIVDAEGTVLDEWTSGEDDHLLFGLGEGDYILTEISAPEGYLTAENLEFSIDRNGKVTVNGDVVEKVTMVDIKMHGLPNTGGNGAGPHFVIMGILLSMLSTTTMITRKA
ncbi:MAG: prealbumin-like fold domain-containing protein [Clostridia bacterium]|nr:prealbumin-like fold domain-containing protein [Clostridia bacterium]